MLQIVSIANTGNQNVLLTGFAIGGINAGDFGIQSNNCPLSPAPLAPNLSCQITLAFTPSVVGIRLASFQLTDSSPGSPHRVSVVGEGVPVIKTLQLNPTNLSFGTVPVGSTGSNLVGVYNSGTAPVTFQSFALSGVNAIDFTITENLCTGLGTTMLNPGATCDVYVNFTPSAVGARSASLQIRSDATHSPQAVQLSGTGQ